MKYDDLKDGMKIKVIKKLQTNSKLKVGDVYTVKKRSSGMGFTTAESPHWNLENGAVLECFARQTRNSHYPAWW